MPPFFMPGFDELGLVLTLLLSAASSAQAQEPTTGYAPVNGLEMYYEIHGSSDGAPLVLLHGSYMSIPLNWSTWIGEFAKTRKVIAVEMQGHGRTTDISRDFSYENLADDIVAMHVTLMEKGSIIIPMVDDFLDAESLSE